MVIICVQKSEHLFKHLLVLRNRVLVCDVSTAIICAEFYLLSINYIRIAVIFLFYYQGYHLDVVWQNSLVGT